MVTIHSVIAEGSEPLNLNSELATKISNIKGHCRIILQVILLMLDYYKFFFCSL